MNNRDKTKQKVLRKRFKAAIKKNKSAVTPEAKQAGAEARRKLEKLDAPSTAPEKTEKAEKAEKPAPAARKAKPPADTAAAQPPAA